MTDTPMTGRTALVTGGGSGLGRAICRELAQRGAHVVAADVNLDGAAQTTALVKDAGGSAEPVHLDVTDPDSVAQVVDDAFARHGEAFDCLVNNAGTDQGARFDRITDEQWDLVTGVNYSGPMRMSREFLRRVVEREEGEHPADIVNVISISAITVGTDAATYNSSKAGLEMLTKVLQREAHEYRWPVRVHGLMPSAMNTPMMEQWHLADEVMMDPAVVARMVGTMVTLPPEIFIQNLVINPRREPHWPR